jgi:hypothetical protein
VNIVRDRNETVCSLHCAAIRRRHAELRAAFICLPK